MTNIHGIWPSFLQKLDFPWSVSRQLEEAQNHSAVDETACKCPELLGAPN